MKKAAVAVLIVGLATACSIPVSKYTNKPFQVHEEDRLRDRAAFDLDCKAEELTLVPLGGPKSAGISGCGKKGTYVVTGQGVWVMNTSDK